MQALKSPRTDRRGCARVRIGGRLLAGLLWLNACDVPTSAPILEPRFVIMGTSTTMTVQQMLPRSVTFEGNAFVLAIEGSAETWTLSEMCGPVCSFANGLVIPKPPFTLAVTSKAALPEGVLSADVRSGAVTMRITNNLNFDPLQPSSTAQGSAVIEVRHGDELIATRTITGSLSPGETSEIVIPFPPIRITGALALSIAINSPAGDAVLVDTAPSNAISSTVNTRIEMTEAVVRLEGRAIESVHTSLDLTDIDDTAPDHVREGALIVRVDNPFAVTGVLGLKVVAEGRSEISKTLTLVPAGQSTQRVPFTRDEMQQILGRVVKISAHGVVNQASDAGVTVRPGDVLRIRADLDLTMSTNAN